MIGPPVSSWVLVAVALVMLGVSVLVITVICCCIRKRKRPSGDKETVRVRPLVDPIGPKVVRIQPPTETRLRSVSKVQPVAEFAGQPTPGTYRHGTAGLQQTSWSRSGLAGDHPVQRRYGSLSGEDQSPFASIYSRTSYAVKVGLIHFALKYDSHSSELTITVIECQNLEKNENGDLPDPYVVVQMLPSIEHQTRVLEKTQTPRFDETFVFQDVESTSLSDRFLHFQVFNFDESDSHRLLGELHFAMTEADPSRENDVRADLILQGHEVRRVNGNRVCANSIRVVRHRVTWGRFCSHLDIFRRQELRPL